STFRLNMNLPRMRYVALDSGSGTQQAMEIDDLADALPALVAEFILFDVCLMGSVEALYEIRHTCSYAIAAPTEVLANSEYDASGMPYSKVLPFLFGDPDDLKKACELYYTHYRDLDISGVSGISDPEMLRSATISLIDMQQLDGLYSVSSGILKGKLSQAAALSVSGMQKYHTDAAAQVFFDMGDVVQALATTSQYQAFQTQLSKTVLYKAATDKFVTITIDPAHFSGLSMYVPLSAWSAYDEYNYYFKSLSWAGVY
ncbi:MAG: clostripain-related cysteine peptidase, partial [Mangrovibacterium sp.]